MDNTRYIFQIYIAYSATITHRAYARTLLCSPAQLWWIIYAAQRRRKNSAGRRHSLSFSAAAVVWTSEISVGCHFRPETETWMWKKNLHTEWVSSENIKSNISVWCAWSLYVIIWNWFNEPRGQLNNCCPKIVVIIIIPHLWWNEKELIMCDKLDFRLLAWAH